MEDIAKAHKFAIEGFAEHLIPVSDSLYAALATEAGDAKAFKEGLEITLKQLISAFEKGRLIEINPAPGSKFDPHQHQAISMVPSEQDANTVVSVLQRGFLIADRVLRPALVTVSQAK
jgi:molecular chaperone GrpE